MEQGFELSPGKKSLGSQSLILLEYILVPAKIDLTTKGKYCKKGVVRANGTNGGKIIILLLTKIVIFHVSFTIVEVKELSF